MELSYHKGEYIMKKFFALFLAAIMCVSLLASCTQGNGPSGESSTPAESSTPSASTPHSSTPESTPESTPISTPPESEESSSNQISIEMPPALELDREMTIFVGELHYEEWLDRDDGDIVNTELFNRVPRVEDNLGIDLYTNRIPGTGAFREQVVSEIKKYTDSTDPNMTVDLCSCYSMWAGSMTLEGKYQNMADNDFLDLSSPYWPKDIVDGSSLDGKIYTVSGDISPSLLWETYCIFFNLELMDKYNIENPIELVNNNKWTLDKVIEITSDIYSDDDTTVSGPNLGDTFAFTFSDMAHIKAFPFALGLRVLEVDDEDGYVLSELYTGEKADAVATKMRDWIANHNGVGIGGKIPGVGYGEAFRQNQAIFNVGNFAFTKYYLTDTGVNYGVVPCPKYDEYQEEYYSYYGNPSAFWGIPYNARSVDDSCALLEALAADAYLCISPAIFEKALKFKYVPGDISGQSHMFDIIREGLVFDPCMTYNETLDKYKRWEEIPTLSGSWISLFNGFAKAQYKIQVKTIVDGIRALPH